MYWEALLSNDTYIMNVKLLTLMFGEVMTPTSNVVQQKFPLA